MKWHVQVTGVASHGDFQLVWTLDVGTEDDRFLVHAVTSDTGHVWDLQCDGHCGTTGDADLDAIVAERVQAAIRFHNVMRDLDAIRPRSRRPARRRAA